MKEVAKNVFLFDNMLYGIPKFGANYILMEEKKAIVDCGPTTSAAKVLEAISQVGLKPEDIDYIIATHIHLDHAGGAGYLLQRMPEAKLVIHRNGVRHFVNPAKLVVSVQQAQGEHAMEMNGEVVPVPEAKMLVMGDGDSLELGKEQTLLFIDGPGHCPHQLCTFETRNRGVFVGDAVGNYAPDCDVLVPITPPPSFDYELYLKTLKRLGELDARFIYFSHYGMSNRVRYYLDLAAEKLVQRKAIIDQLAAEGKMENAVDLVREVTCAEVEPLRHSMPLLFNQWCNGAIRMSAEGFVKNYCERYREAHS